MRWVSVYRNALFSHCIFLCFALPCLALCVCVCVCVCVFYTRIQVAGQMGKSFVRFDFWVPDPYLIC